MIVMLLLFTNNSYDYLSGKIKSISFNQNYIGLTLEETNEDFIIFTKERLPLRTEDKITVVYKKQNYNNNNQNIIQKIWKN